MPDDLNAPVTDGERLDAARCLHDGDTELCAKFVADFGGTRLNTGRLLDALCLARRRERALREAGDELVRRLNESDVCPVCRMDDEHADDMPCAKLAVALDATDNAKGGPHG